MHIHRMTYIQGYSLHQLVRAKDWKKPNGDWLINDTTSKAMTQHAIVKRQEEALWVLIWKGNQDKSLCNKSKGRYRIFK